MQNPPPVQTTKSSTGLDENVAAVLAYVFHWLSGLVFFLIEKDSRLVRFHAVQALILGIVWSVCMFVLWIAWFIIGIAATAINETLGSLVMLLLGLVIGLFFLAIVAAWIMGMVKAYQGQYYKLPIIGNFAEKFSTK
jgi:uncharacterized membrane protein